MKSVSTIVLMMTVISVKSWAGGASDCPDAVARVLKSGGASASTLSRDDIKQIEKIVSEQRHLAGIADQLAQKTKAHRPEFLLGLLLEWLNQNPGERLPRLAAHQIGLALNSEKPVELWSRIPRSQQSAWKRAAEQYLNWINRRTVEAYDLGIDMAVRLKLAGIASPRPGVQVAWLEQLKRDLADWLSQGQFNGIHPARVYQFAKSAVYRAAGFEVAPLTDLVVVRKGLNFNVTLLGTHPLGELPKSAQQQNVYGVYFATFDQTSIPGSKSTGTVLLDQDYSWSLGGTPFSAKLKVKLGPPADSIAPRIRGLDFEGLWADGKLGGVVLFDNNLGDFRPSLVGEYKEYFQDQGFRFTRSTVEDSEEFLKELIETGEADYMIREGHALGGTSLVGLSPKITVWKGTKPHSGSRSRTEVVHFIHSQGAVQRGEVSALRLADWMSKRSKLPRSPQLLFVDASCYSLSGLEDLVSAVSHPKFVAVGAGEGTDTFVNESETALYQILEGIRHEESFGSIRSRIRRAYKEAKKLEESDPSFMDTVDEEAYAFPDEDLWRNSVIKGVHRPLNVQLVMKDSRGQVVDLEDLRNAERP